MQTNLKHFLVAFIFVLSCFCNAQGNRNEFVVVIDPGHGGRDSGTPGTKRYRTTEKDIALDVSLALGKLIQDNLPQVKVIYTRDKDVFPTLNARAIKANKANADLFISIHCNAQPKGKGTAYGSETYVLGLHKNATNLEVAKRENSVIFLEKDHEETYKDFDINDSESLIGLMLMQEDYLDQSIELAAYIENEFQTTAKRKSRGVKQAGFWVLSQTYMPSVLVELGFLTHKKEEDYLNSNKGKSIMTKALFNAVQKYIEMHFKLVNKAAILEKKQDEDDTVTQDIYPEITFKVQIAASSKRISTKSYNFKGLKEISRDKKGNIYKYYYGKTSDYSKIKTQLKHAKSKGYDECFIVAYKNAKRIPLNEALKSTSN
ncbi:MAG: N-acetylmuramoyl-L-alanine amidase [Flavobacteriaceae bacterium]|nr:N-acetylmuramoyl-L-alanine amidase [Flavobacteriaceae bacterium]